MSNIQLDIPNTRVVVRQPSVIVDRSRLPIQSVAEFALTASYAATASSVNLPTDLISSSVQIAQYGFISSSTVQSVEAMSSASYALITPVSGTLYIIVD